MLVFSSENCPRCERVKRLLSFAGVEFTDVPAAKMAEVHDGWREDGSVDLMAWRTMQPDGIGDQLPIIKRDGEDNENFQQALDYALDAALVRVSQWLLDNGRADLPANFSTTLRALLTRVSALPYELQLPIVEKVVRAGGKCPCSADPARAPQCPCPTHKQEITASGTCGCGLLVGPTAVTE